jgi:hypothetical protein
MKNILEAGNRSKKKIYIQSYKGFYNVKKLGVPVFDNFGRYP